MTQSQRILLWMQSNPYSYFFANVYSKFSPNKTSFAKQRLFQDPNTKNISVQNKSNGRLKECNKVINIIPGRTCMSENTAFIALLP